MPFYLSDKNGSGIKTYGITAVGAFKCALANSIAFAAIIGRGGMLEALVIAVFGTWLYELNRQIILRYAIDFGGSITIFCFGGVYGSMISLLSYYCRHKNTAQEH